MPRSTFNGTIPMNDGALPVKGMLMDLKMRLTACVPIHGGSF